MPTHFVSIIFNLPFAEREVGCDSIQ